MKKNNLVFFFIDQNSLWTVNIHLKEKILKERRLKL